jgi:hypothetical protein
VTVVELLCRARWRKDPYRLRLRARRGRVSMTVMAARGFARSDRSIGRPVVIALMMVSVTLCSAAPAVSLAIKIRPAAPSWWVQTSASHSASMAAISCSAADACTAVGSKEIVGPDTSVIDRWDGMKWASQRRPALADGFLTGVSCYGRTGCVAVGTANSACGSWGQSIAEHWDGRSWSIMSTPAHRCGHGSRGTLLSAVSCRTARFCMTVGSTELRPADGIIYASVADRWDGRQWMSTAVPPLGRSQPLSALSCPTASECAAAGTSDNDGLLMRWDGTEWHVTTVRLAGRSVTLTGISCWSANACVAVGSTSDGSFTDNGPEIRPLALHWDGVAAHLDDHLPGSASINADLEAIDCTSSTSCVAVGERYGKIFGDQWMVRLHGSTWSSVHEPAPSPTVFDATLDGISCPSAESCTAVGSYSDARPQAEPLILTTRQPTFTVSHIRLSPGGTARFTVKMPGAGTVDSLITAWKSNLAGAADSPSRLLSAPHRFVYGRSRLTAHAAGVLTGTVRPSALGARLLSRPRYRIVLRLWVSFTPRGGTTRSVGYYGLHIGG